ncbi:MAG: sensor histidine kinase [Planctomycetota bacterium]
MTHEDDPTIRLQRELEDSKRKCPACRELVTGLDDRVAELTKALAVAKQAVTTRNDFLAMVAHDLRSPLSVVSLSSDVLLKMMDTLEAGRPARKLVQRIQHSTDLMTHFVSDLLDVSSVESGHLSFTKSRHDVAELVAETCDTLSALCDERGIELRQDIKVKPGGTVLCDRARFLQLMSNLVGNAIKFTARNGEITVGATQDATHSIFSVRDTGVGIAEEDLPFIFDQYRRSKRVSEGGYGLGLAIVKNLVEAHGGTVSVVSAKGKGSTFAFTLPCGA